MYTPQTTSLGLPEAVERVGAYLFFFISGLLLLIVERNPNVRHHARQSVVVFGILFLVRLALGFIATVLGWLPLIGWALRWPFDVLGTLDTWVIVVAWIVLMIGAAISPNFTLPGTRRMRQVLS
jgi:uncharacterized membrane protein